METVLIWSCGIAGALLTMAVASALGERMPRPAGAALSVLSGLGLTGVFAMLTGLAVLAGQAAWGISALALFVVGAVAIVVLGRRSSAPGLAPRAASWPLQRLVLVLAAVLAILGTSARNARLAAQQALFARRAELASLEQLFWPAVPASMNAAPLYALALEKLVPIDRVPGARAAFEDVGNKDSLAQVNAPALAEWVRDNEAALTLTVEGTQRPGYSSVEDALWRNSPFGAGRAGQLFRLEMSHTGRDPSTMDKQVGLRRLGDLLQTRALLRAFSGRLPLAIQDANALFLLTEQTSSRWLRPERLIEKLLAAPGLNAVALSGLRIPRGESLDMRLKRTLIRSEHLWFSFSDRLLQSTDPLDLVFNGTRELFWAQESTTRMQKAYDDLWEAAYAPPAQRLVRLREAQARMRQVRAAELWAPRVVDDLELLIDEEAARECAVTGIAVARYRLQHGAWPAGLEALVPDQLDRVPHDPFDGAPLRYRPAAAAALVYSVGPDLKDGSGNEGARKASFTVPAPR